MQKLHLFSIDDESILPTDQRIYYLLQNEALFNGGIMILERVTEDVDDHITSFEKKALNNVLYNKQHFIILFFLQMAQRVTIFIF